MRPISLCAIVLFCAACPGGSDTGAHAGAVADDSGTADANAICDTFTKVGDPCGPTGATVCFRSCKKDGCQCKAGPNGGVWTCTSDFSCMPEAGPLDDAGSD
jgi:hypothetical protein